MARLNTDDDFWPLCGLIAPQIGSLDCAIGQAMRFRQLAQQRFKQKKVITKADFAANGFHPALIGVFAIEKNGYFFQSYNEAEHFWLEKRRAAGKKGGLAKAENTRKTPKKKDAPPPCDSNGLAASKTVAKGGKSYPLPLPLPLSIPLAVAIPLSKKSPAEIAFEKEHKQKEAREAAEAAINKHWLIDLWNENCGPHLAKIDEVSPELVVKCRKAAARTLGNREKWREAFKKVAASKCLTGRVEKRPFRANFLWLLRPGIREDIANGTYDDFNAPLIANVSARKLPPSDVVMSDEERKAAANAREEFAAQFLKKKPLLVDAK